MTNPMFPHGQDPATGEGLPDPARTLSDDVFRVLLDLYMVSDPWPLTDAADVILHALIDSEGQARGFTDWVTAYHRFEKS